VGASASLSLPRSARSCVASARSCAANQFELSPMIASWPMRSPSSSWRALITNVSYSGSFEVLLGGAERAIGVGVEVGRREARAAVGEVGARVVGHLRRAVERVGEQQRHEARIAHHCRDRALADARPQHFVDALAQTRLERHHRVLEHADERPQQARRERRARCPKHAIDEIVGVERHAHHDARLAAAGVGRASRAARRAARRRASAA
jgi:hypothetical protein